MERREFDYYLPTLKPLHKYLGYPNPYEILAKQNVKEATLKSYVLSLDNLRRVADSHTFDYYFITPRLAIISINKVFGENTYYTQKIFNVWNKYLTKANYDKDNDVKKIYADELRKINDFITQKRSENVREGKLEKEWISLKELKQFRKELVNNGSYHDALIISLYTDVPPVRNDYWHLKIRNFDTCKDNYYSNGTIVLNDYKTVKFYGKITFNLTIAINEIAKACMVNNNSDFMFKTSTGKPFKTGNNFTKYIQKMIDVRFQKSVNIQMFRNIYLSHLYEKIRPVKKLEAIAKIMGHTVNQGLLYRKYDPNDLKEDDEFLITLESKEKK
ncbi:MAG: hypothetical protein N2B06_12390 [Clostridium sp.]